MGFKAAENQVQEETKHSDATQQKIWQGWPWIATLKVGWYCDVLEKNKQHEVTKHS